MSRLRNYWEKTKIKEKDRGHILDAKSNNTRNREQGGIYFWMVISADENGCYSVLGLNLALQSLCPFIGEMKTPYKAKKVAVYCKVHEKSTCHPKSCWEINRWQANFFMDH